MTDEADIISGQMTEMRCRIEEIARANASAEVMAKELVNTLLACPHPASGDETIVVTSVAMANIKSLAMGLQKELRY